MVSVNDVPTRAQRAVLENPPAFCGYAEAELATGLIYRQLDKSIAACRRRGWLDENDFPTPDGAAALLRHNA